MSDGGYLVIPDATMATYGRTDDRDDRGAPLGTPCVLAIRLDDEFMARYRAALIADTERRREVA